MAIRSRPRVARARSRACSPASPPVCCSTGSASGARNRGAGDGVARPEPVAKKGIGGMKGVLAWLIGIPIPIIIILYLIDVF
jgi:hypothetical protein